MPLFPVDPSDRKPIGGDRVSAIGLGTWAIRNPRRALRVLVEAVETGLVDNIDTAEMYGEGAAEKLVGELLRRVGRDRVFVTTKVLPWRLRSPEVLERALRASLQRLGVSTVDLVLIHWPLDSLPVAEQVRRLERVAIGRGYARYIGVSNFDHRQLGEALEATASAEIVADQVHYSVLRRGEVEEKLLPLALRNNVTIQAYTPLERGLVARHPVVRRVAERLGRTPVQVALNYLISRPRVVAIPKTEQVGHLREILGAMGWRLPVEALEELEKLL